MRDINEVKNDIIDLLDHVSLELVTASKGLGAKWTKKSFLRVKRSDMFSDKSIFRKVLKKIIVIIN